MTRWTTCTRYDHGYPSIADKPPVDTVFVCDCGQFRWVVVGTERGSYGLFTVYPGVRTEDDQV